MKVFLGGTCNESKWRDELMPMLEANGIEYFNPVVDDWTPECQKQELEERENCDFVLYVITPKMTGVYSIAEVVDDSNKRPDKTILFIAEQDGEKFFDKAQRKSLNSVKGMVADNGANTCNSLAGIVAHLDYRKNDRFRAK